MLNRSLRADDWTAEALEKYAEMVYRLAYAQTRNRQDADDVFQEVFIRLVKADADFESEEHLKAWLIRVTINCARTIWLSAWRRRMVLMDEETWNRVPAEEKTEGNETLEKAMAVLPRKYRTVIHLFYYEEMPVNRIAEALHEKPSTIRSQLTRARQMLKKLLTSEGGESACLRKNTKS